MDPRPVRVLSLCSGGGGLDLGSHAALRNLGLVPRTVCYVEREAYACAVLAARMEEGSLDPAPVWTDIGTFDARRWRGAVDLVLAGIPCQPHSVAGKRGGAADARWIWPDVAAIIRDCGATLVFLENVPGLLTSSGGAAFGQILADLAALGFDAEWVCVRASDVGAPHRRERVFILAHARRGGLDADEQGRVLQQPHGTGTEAAVGIADRCGGREVGAERGRGEAGGGTRQQPGLDGAGTRKMGDALGAGLEGRPSERGDNGGEREAVERAGGDGVADAERTGRRPARPDEPRILCGRTKTSERSGELSGIAFGRSCKRDGILACRIAPWPPPPDDADGWRSYLADNPDLAPATEAQPALRRGDDGVADRVGATRADELRLLGNGVVPAQAEAAFLELHCRLTA